MKGKVYLVGVGPGDPSLMTLKAVEVLKQADTVLFDRLINPNVLKLPQKNTELIDVGKSPGNHTIPQSEINRILTDKALEGKKVVRLKGGDPFVFGRGGEEALYLQERGIPFEVIPGVTSAVSVPAYAGIPVTHRGAASSLHVITGHGKHPQDLPDSEVLAKLEGTLVFLMGINNIKHIADGLMECGKPENTPVAVIMRGTMPRQKTAVGTLSNICDKVKQADIKNPAVIVVGEVANLRGKLSWYEKGKLFGKKILFLGTGLHEGLIINSDIAFGKVKQQGAEVLICPTLKITPLMANVKQFLGEVKNIDILIFTSKNAVDAFILGMKEQKLDARYLSNKEIWAVGSQTVEKLTEAHLYADLVPDVYTSKALLKHITEKHQGKKATVITSNIGGRQIITGLKDRGLKAQKITAYKNEPNFEVKEELLKAIDDGIDTAVFTSPSSFNFMREIVGDAVEFLKDTKIAAIGPVTKETLEEAGYTVHIMPAEHTLKGLADEILAYY